MPFDGLSDGRTLAEPVTLTPSAEALANRILEIEEITRIRWRAAELLEKTGWCQDVAGDDRGRSCMAYALLRAAPWSTPLHCQDVDLYALSMGFGSGRDMIIWNDAAGRTREEVIARLLGGSNAA